MIKSKLNHEYKPNGKMVSYIVIPLHLNDHKSRKVMKPFSNEEIDLIDYIPNLKIKKLIFGPNSHFKNKSDLFEYEIWIKKKWGYDFDVEVSNIEF